MQRKLTLSFLVFAFIPLLVILSLIAYFLFSKNTSNHAEDLTHFIRTQIEHKLRERALDLQSFSMSKAFWADDVESNPIFNHSLTEYFNALVETNKEYLLILMVDKNGIVKAVSTKNHTGKLISSEELLGSSFQRAPWFKRAIRSTEMFIDQPRSMDFLNKIYGHTQKTALPIFQKVTNKNVETIGVWVVFSDTDFLQQILDEAAGLTDTPGEIGIYTYDGESLAEYSSTHNQELDSTEMATDIINSYNLNWFIVAYLEKYALIEYAKRYAWAVFAMLGLIFLYALVIARRFALPLVRLSQIADAISKDTAKVEIPYQNRKDDIGRLAKALTVIHKKCVVSNDKQARVIDLEEIPDKISKVEKLASNLSTQTNLLAIAASMEAVKFHELDKTAEVANELAEKTTNTVRELLRRLEEIKKLA